MSCHLEIQIVKGIFYRFLIVLGPHPNLLLIENFVIEYHAFAAFLQVHRINLQIFIHWDSMNDVVRIRYTTHHSSVAYICVSREVILEIMSGNNGNNHSFYELSYFWFSRKNCHFLILHMSNLMKQRQKTREAIIHQGKIYYFSFIDPHYQLVDSLCSRISYHG